MQTPVRENISLQSLSASVGSLIVLQISAWKPEQRPGDRCRGRQGNLKVKLLQAGASQPKTAFQSDDPPH
ncbi:MAG: hypothetical protein LBS65_09515 [Desulfovibrio sp.]|jgi:hypothetical protein|nr:hypothetical protein [Desulfovibrio sp.]